MHDLIKRNHIFIFRVKVNIIFNNEQNGVLLTKNVLENSFLVIASSFLLA